MDFYALLAAVLLGGVAASILAATGNLTITLKRNQAKPTAPPKP